MIIEYEIGNILYSLSLIQHFDLPSYFGVRYTVYVFVVGPPLLLNASLIRTPKEYLILYSMRGFGSPGLILPGPS